jgi:uncharacterized protein YqjF (DUF2071 family)
MAQILAPPAAILANATHRGWPPPRGPWIMRQTWSELLLAHWPVDAAALAPINPPGVALDTFDGRAWVSVVTFRMSHVRLRAMPTIPTTGAFPEVNVRTYVTAEGKPGVLFLSLDASSRLAVWVARHIFHLPYFYSDLTLRRAGDTLTLESQRAGHDPSSSGALHVTYRPTGPAAIPAPGTLDDWLTARYCLYTVDGAGSTVRAEVHHAPWALRPATAEFARNTLAVERGITLGAPVRLHYADRLDVLLWDMTPVHG